MQTENKGYEITLLLGIKKIKESMSTTGAAVDNVYVPSPFETQDVFFFFYEVRRAEYDIKFKRKFTFTFTEHTQL